MNFAESLDAGAIDELFSLAYEELRRLAAAVKRGDRGATINPTALVNEAWLRLRGSAGLAVESRLHFKRVAARAMRQILVEAARRRETQKRGGQPPLVGLGQAAGEQAAPTLAAEDIVALERALRELERLAPRQAQLVEARFFAGFETPELIELFQVSEATITRDWRMARAWLAHRLQGGWELPAVL